MTSWLRRNPHMKHLVPLSLPLARSEQSFAASYPAFVVADVAHTGVSQSGVIFGDQDTFRGSYDLLFDLFFDLFFSGFVLVA